MILDYLYEEFFDGDHIKSEYYDGYAEIYKNPTPREMKDIATSDKNDEHSIRLGMDENGDIFAWDYQILHDEMEEIIDRHFYLRFEYNYPEKDIWLGSGTMPSLWTKFGTDGVVERLNRIIPGLNSIKFSGNSEIKNAWEKDDEL